MNKTNRARDSRENAKWYHRREVKKSKDSNLRREKCKRLPHRTRAKAHTRPRNESERNKSKRAPETDEMIRADSVGMGCLMPLVGRERGIRTANEQIQCQTKRAQNASDMFEKRIKPGRRREGRRRFACACEETTIIKCRTAETNQKKTKLKLL
jgi:hypothetical protein